MASPLPGRAVTYRANGYSDAIDGTNAFPGAMTLLQNLIPSPGNRQIFVPRPGVVGLAGGGSAPTKWGSFVWGQAPWGGFDSIDGAAQINGLLVVGDIIYGMIASTSGAYSGLDVPFAFNVVTQAFLPISIPRGTAALPTTPTALVDWIPPSMAQVGNRIIITHPGFTGGLAPYFGWLDVSGFSDDTHTGNTNTSKTVNNLSANVLQAGWQVGMTITDSAGDIPANTTITAIATGGLSCTISNAATASTVGTTFTVAGGTAAAPLYDAGNTNLNGLVQVPNCVGQFNGRAYFGLPNGSIPFSDSLVPCQMTNATQVLQPANGIAITAMAGLPYQQFQGGILQALICFQGDSGMQQITGDSVTNNLALNGLGIGVGTLSPNTVCQTERGLGFISEDGFRILTFLGQITEPIGADGDGACVPFLNALYPSRMAAAYNQNVFRVSVQNGAKSGNPWEEYWYHFNLKTWSGPHTFPASLIQAYQGTSNHGFITASPTINATLFVADAIPNQSTVYDDAGAAIICQWKTVLMPDNDEMSENTVVESTIAASLPQGIQLNIAPTNESGAPLDNAVISGPQVGVATWGNMVWGPAQWSRQQNYLAQYDIPWNSALTFKQWSVAISAPATANLAIGNFYYRYEALPYRMQAMSGVAVSGAQR